MGRGSCGWIFRAGWVAGWHAQNWIENASKVTPEFKNRNAFLSGTRLQLLSSNLHQHHGIWTFQDLEIDVIYITPSLPLIWFSNSFHPFKKCTHVVYCLMTRKFALWLGFYCLSLLYYLIPLLQFDRDSLSLLCLRCLFIDRANMYVKTDQVYRSRLAFWKFKFFRIVVSTHLD